MVVRHKPAAHRFRNLGACSGEHGVIKGIKHNKFVSHDLIDQITPHAGREGKL